MKRLVFLVAALTVAACPTAGDAGPSASADTSAAEAASPPERARGRVLRVAERSHRHRSKARKRASKPGRDARPSRPGGREHRLQSLRTPTGKGKSLEAALGDTISSICASRYLRSGTTAVYVVDAATGKPIYAVHEDEQLNPASLVKLISSAAALDALGPDYHYVTRLLGPRPGADGTVAGDLYLAGGYDPTLGPGDLASLAQAVAARGVTRVRGDLYVGPHPWRESVAKPRILVRVKGTERGKPPEVVVTPATGFVTVRVDATTRRKRGRPRITYDFHRVENELAGDSYELVVSGTISPGKRSSKRIWLDRGAEFSAHILRQALLDAGLEVTGKVGQITLDEYNRRARSAPVELAQHESRSLGDIVARVNKLSINRMADRVIMSAASARYGGEPTLDGALSLMRAWLKDRAGVDPGKVVLDSGSGLSYNTELSARQIVTVLRAAGGYEDLATSGGVIAGQNRDGDRAQAGPGALAAASASSVTRTASPEVARARAEAFLSSLAVGGVDGTLRARFRRSDARGQILAKTGTLSRVIALSGVVTLHSPAAGSAPDALIFAIVSNGHNRRYRRQVRKAHEKIVDSLYRYLDARAQGPR